MNGIGYALFDTPIGRCAVAWGGRGIVAVQLPERNDAATRARILRHRPEAVESPMPEAVGAAVALMQALLRGEAADLSPIELDLSGVPELHRRAYAVARTIPPGDTMTYGEIAAAIGDPGAARIIGQAMGQNPCTIVVPCHRVLAAGDRPGGFSGGDGVRTKLRMLAIEGARRGGMDSLFRDEEARGA